MNIGYIIGLVLAIIVFVLGMAGGFPPYNFGQLGNFVDGASVMIVIGCSIGIVMASFPLKTFLGMPKHFAIMLKNPKMKPENIINSLVDLAQIARKDGLLALEEKANEQEDPFFKQAIMLIVDANDPDRVRATLENDIECMTKPRRYPRPSAWWVPWWALSTCCRTWTPPAAPAPLARTWAWP